MVQLLDLPAEILLEILIRAVHVRSFARALRLRLINSKGSVMRIYVTYS